MTTLIIIAVALVYHLHTALAVSLTPTVTYGFEMPVVTSYENAAALATTTPSVATPFAFSGGAGIAHVGSLYDPPYAGSPEGSQYAFIQTAGAIAGNISALTAGATYYIDLYWATSFNAVATPAVFSFNVIVNDVAVVNITVTTQATWTRALSATFIAPSSGNAALFFTNAAAVNPTAAVSVLIDAIIIQSGSPPGLLVNDATRGDFEYPSLPAATFSYGGAFVTSAPSLSNPWSFGIVNVSNAGIATVQSYWDPSGSGTPRGNQYAFIECATTAAPSTLSVLAVNLTPNSAFYLDFWFANSASTSAPLTTNFAILADNNVIFTTSFTTLQPWLHTTSASFVAPSSGTVRLFFINSQSSSNDQTVIIDQVIIRPLGYIPTPQATVNGVPNVWSSFESPLVGTAAVQYASNFANNMANNNPWILNTGNWLVTSGIAASGSPFDPLGTRPFVPDGNQYAFLQTLGVANTSSITATYSQLIAGTSYNFQFWYGSRNQSNILTLCNLTFSINNQIIFNRLATNSIPWTPVKTLSFIAPQTGEITVTIQSINYNNNNHVWVLDKINLNINNPPITQCNFTITGPNTTYPQYGALITGTLTYDTSNPLLSPYFLGYNILQVSGKRMIWRASRDQPTTFLYDSTAEIINIMPTNNSYRQTYISNNPIYTSEIIEYTPVTYAIYYDNILLDYNTFPVSLDALGWAFLMSYAQVGTVNTSYGPVLLLSDYDGGITDDQTYPFGGDQDVAMFNAYTNFSCAPVVSDVSPVAPTTYPAGCNAPSAPPKNGHLMSIVLEITLPIIIETYPEFIYTIITLLAKDININRQSFTCASVSDTLDNTGSIVTTVTNMTTKLSLYITSTASLVASQELAHQLVVDLTTSNSALRQSWTVAALPTIQSASTVYTPSSGNSLSAGAIAGIVVASVIAMIFCILVLFCKFRNYICQDAKSEHIDLSRNNKAEISKSNQNFNINQDEIETEMA